MWQLDAETCPTCRKRLAHDRIYCPLFPQVGAVEKWRSCVCLIHSCYDYTEVNKLKANTPIRTWVTGTLRDHLRAKGYDGLWCDDCGCTLDDFAPCGEDILDCKPGYRTEAGENHPDGFDFIIGPKAT